jgi:hypothetical protein
LDILSERFFKKKNEDKANHLAGSLKKLLKHLLKIEMIVTQDMLAPSIVYSLLFAVNKIKVFL